MNLIRRLFAPRPSAPVVQLVEAAASVEPGAAARYAYPPIAQGDGDPGEATSTGQCRQCQHWKRRGIVAGDCWVDTDGVRKLEGDTCPRFIARFVYVNREGDLS